MTSNECLNTNNNNKKQNQNLNEKNTSKNMKEENQIKNNTCINASKDYKTIFFISNVYNNILCPLCNSSFTTKFNMERHVRDNHEKSAHKNPPNVNKVSDNVDKKLETSVKKTDVNYLHKKRYENKKNDKIINENINELENEKNILKTIGKTIQEKLVSKNNKDKNEFQIEKSFDFSISDTSEIFSNKWAEAANKINLYHIINKYKYIPLKNYFFFKTLVIGKGKNGTVWFGIDSNNASPIAIKSPNNNIADLTFLNEVEIMKKLKKYRIFSFIYDSFEFNGRKFLIENLHGPSLDKIVEFCDNKLSINTIYQIGIEILYCIKLFHEEGYLYLDLKSDNIAILLNPILYNDKHMHLTLIDYGFAIKYKDLNGNHLTPDNSSKKHGNIYLASINSLSGLPVSRKDDIITFCYFFNGSILW
jgi:hypothetical protein